MPPRYSWNDHPEAVLGTVYLYFSFGCDPRNVPDEEVAAFVRRHQDRGRLSTEKVRAALSAVGHLDGGGGLGPSHLLRDIWDALANLRDRLPQA
jgi:hypothetical protein